MKDKTPHPKSVLLIISGSIAAYKSLEIIRGFSAKGIAVHAILTKGGAEFITPLAVSSLSGTKTYTDLFSLTDEVEMGHIELSRIADVVLVAPASADVIAKMATGQCNDLASTALLATNKPVFIAPAMNHKMWSHPATQRNVAQLRADGISIIDPTEGDMACKEFGVGRMAEPDDIVEHLLQNFSDLADIISTPSTPQSLSGLHAIVTSGPTHEPIDPVRYLGNRSSGKQGHAIATALADLGAKVTLVSGPTDLPDPAHTHINTKHVTTAASMHHTVMNALPADVFISAAAVADWQVDGCAKQKIKKEGGQDTLSLTFSQTPDILHDVGHHKQRPGLVVGFAAETEKLLEHANQKRTKKRADWIIANDVSGDVFGADSNTVTIVNGKKPKPLNTMPKAEVAKEIANQVAAFFDKKSSKPTKRKRG